jgi:hypothetical protein
MVISLKESKIKNYLLSSLFSIFEDNRSILQTFEFALFYGAASHEGVAVLWRILLA